MKHFIIATDNPENPTTSKLVIGPEGNDDDVRRKFYAARTASSHPDGAKVWELWTRTGRAEVSIARNNHTIKKGIDK